nr:ER membrane protein complex subunit 10 [Halyomorpha halys]
MSNLHGGSPSVQYERRRICAEFTKRISDNKETKVSGGLYRLKSVVKTSKQKENAFYSFMKMDTLSKAGFLTSTIVHLDQSGSVISVKLYPKKIYRATVVHRNNSTVTFKGSEQGPVPDLTAYILKLEHERAAKEKLAGQDNRSFLAKYWMYIVPLVMFVILSGSNADPGASRPQQNR